MASVLAPLHIGDKGIDELNGMINHYSPFVVRGSCDLSICFEE